MTHMPYKKGTRLDWQAAVFIAQAVKQRGQRINTHAKEHT